ncbi:MAG: hypothetical protein IID43_04805 [Planctomycetes bacterium]|nr:hypothetical protein [Planctomycetota bacterium]
MSIVSDSGDPGLQGTKNWRLEWWGEIIGYTFGGPYFWTGKGFGVNLAEDDGFEVSAQGLRSPHNGHMTALARMGVPGFGLWIAVHVTFGVSLLLAFRRARRAGDVFWAQIDAWLLAYWVAALVVGAFDVYLEGPQGAIWLWTVVGLGFAAIRLQRPADGSQVRQTPIAAQRMVTGPPAEGALRDLEAFRRLDRDPARFKVSMGAQSEKRGQLYPYVQDLKINILNDDDPKGGWGDRSSGRRRG